MKILVSDIKLVYEEEIKEEYQDNEYELYYVKYKIINMIMNI